MKYMYTPSFHPAYPFPSMNPLEPQRVWLLALPLQCLRPSLSFILAVGGFCVDECCSASDLQYQYILLHLSSQSAVKWVEMEAFLNRMNCTGQRWSCRGNALSGHCAADVCMHPGFRLMRARLQARDPRLLVWRGVVHNCAAGGLLMSYLPALANRRRAAPVSRARCVDMKKEEDAHKADWKHRPLSAPIPSTGQCRIRTAFNRLRLQVECIQHSVISSSKRSLVGAAADCSHKRQRTAAGCSLRRGGGLWAAHQMRSAAASNCGLPSIRPNAPLRVNPKVQPPLVHTNFPVVPVFKVPAVKGVSHTASVTPPPSSRIRASAPVKQEHFVERENDRKWTSGWAC